MEKLTSSEPGYSDSTSQLSEAPDITNWFSSYVYESFPFTSLPKDSENEIDGDRNKENPGVSVSNEDYNKPMNKKTMRQISNESLISEPPDIGNWFSSYVYESPVLDTSDGLELSLVHGESGCKKEIETDNETAKIGRLFDQELVSSSKGKDFSESQFVLPSDGLELSTPGESEYVKETETENETAKIERNHVYPWLFDQQLVSSSKVKDLSQSQSLLSEPPDVRNWFSSYEYQSPQLSDNDEFGFPSPEKDRLIIDESDTEEEKNSGIFRKAKSKQESIAPDMLNENDCKDNVVANKVKEVSSDNSYADQRVKKISSFGLFDASIKEKSSFSSRISHCNPKPQSPSKNEASIHVLRPKHIQETISMNSSKQKSPRKAARKVSVEENLESTDDKENVDEKSIETGFVTLKKARFREGLDQCSMRKPNRGVFVECSSSKEFKKIAREKGEEEERRKKRRVLGEMSNQQFPGAEEIAGKWHCPQKKKGKSVPPLKQLRLDAWIHKV